jgi:hypothetical protein
MVFIVLGIIKSSSVAMADASPRHKGVLNHTAVREYEMTHDTCLGWSYRW